MVEYEESIYNLIPKEQYVPQKQKRYKSQYPSNLAPTASTFGLKTTSKPVCANLAGKYNLEGGAHSHQAGGATMGAAKGTLRPDQTAFRKKGTGNPVLIDKKEGKHLDQYRLFWLFRLIYDNLASLKRARSSEMTKKDQPEKRHWRENSVSVPVGRIRDCLKIRLFLICRLDFSLSSTRPMQAQLRQRDPN